MADVLTKEQRHKNMSHIKGKDTFIEVKLRHLLWEKGTDIEKITKIFQVIQISY